VDAGGVPFQTRGGHSAALSAARKARYGKREAAKSVDASVSELTDQGSSAAQAVSARSRRSEREPLQRRTPPRLQGSGSAEQAECERRRLQGTPLRLLGSGSAEQLVVCHNEYAMTRLPLCLHAAKLRTGGMCGNSRLSILKELSQASSDQQAEMDVARLGSARGQFVDRDTEIGLVSRAESLDRHSIARAGAAARARRSVTVLS